MTFAVRVADAELTPERPEPGRVLAGNPVTSRMVLTATTRSSAASGR